MHYSCWNFFIGGPFVCGRSITHKIHYEEWRKQVARVWTELNWYRVGWNEKTFVEIWASITARQVLSAAGGSSISVTDTREKSAAVSRGYKICNSSRLLKVNRWNSLKSERPEQLSDCSLTPGSTDAITVYISDNFKVFCVLRFMLHMFSLMTTD